MISLAKQERDKRTHLFSLDRLEYAQTDDRYWNTAQKEMLITGKMHPYMRMYWCKRLLTRPDGYSLAFKTEFF